MDESRPDPAPDAGSDADVWAGIVASFHGPSAQPPPGEPPADPTGDVELLPPPTDEQPVDGTDDGSAAAGQLDMWQPTADDAQPGPAGPAGVGPWRQHVPPEPPVEHFVPPDPPPLPATDAITRAAWLGVLGAPALFVLAGLLRWQLPAWGTALGVIGFVGGFALLVWRMRDRDPGAGPDNGAVV